MNKAPFAILDDYDVGSESDNDSIMLTPSHEISANLREREDDLSPMADFSQAMTVRQFLDLIAYIRSR